MKRALLTSAVAFALLLSMSMPAIAASGIRVVPFEYDPGKTRAVSAAWVTHAGLPDAGDSDHALYLAKKTATSTNAAAGAFVDGVEGITLTSLGFDYRNDGWCGAGAPRFNVTPVSGPTYFFFGCAYGTHTAISGTDWTRVRFSDADAYPANGVTPWPGFGSVVVKTIVIIFDEGTDVGPGYAYLDNVDVNGALAGKPGNAFIPATWSLFGGAEAASGDGMPAPSIRLSSTSTIPYSGVAYMPSEALTFAGISSLSTSYKIEVGDCGGGSPRFSIGLDTNGDGARDGSVFVYIGPAPSFTECTTGWQTTGNLLDSLDLRFDTSQFAALGGTFYDSYAHALVMLGSEAVTGVSLVLDGAWLADQVFLVDNVEVNGNTLQQAP